MNLTRPIYGRGAPTNTSVCKAVAATILADQSETRTRNRMTDARLWHPWLRINRILGVMLQTRWSAESWLIVRVEFRRTLALRSEIRRAGWFN